MGRPSRTAAVKARDSVTSAYNYNPLQDEVEEAHSQHQQAPPSKGKGKSTKRKAADDDDDSQDEFKIDGNNRAGTEEGQGSGIVDEDDDDTSSLVISEQDQEDSMEEDENATPQPSSSNRASKSKGRSKSTTKSIGGGGSKSKGSGGGGGVTSTSKSTSDNRSGGGGPLNKIDNSRIKFIKTSAKSSKSHVAPGFMEIVPTFNPSFPSNHSIKVKSKLQRKPLHFLQKNFLKLTGSKNQWPQSDSQPDLTYQDPNEEDFKNLGIDGDGDGDREKEGSQSLNEIILEFVMTLSLFNLDQVRDVGWFPGKVDVRTMMKWTKELDSQRDDGMELDQDQEEEDTDERLIGMPIRGRGLRHRLEDLKILSPSQALPYVNPAPVPSNAPRPAPNLHVPAPENSSTEDPDVDVDPNPESNPQLFLEASPNLTGDSLKIALGPIDLQTEVSLQRGQSLRLDSIPLSSTSSKDRMEIDSDNNDQDSDIEEKKKWWKKSKKGTHLLNVGGLVYDLDFRPLPHHLCQGSEFLAISTGNNKNDPFPRINYGMKLKDPTPDSIQIWEIQSDIGREDQENETIEKKKTATKKGKEKEIDPQDKVESDDGGAKDRNGKAKEVLRICTDFGKAIKLRWFPNGHDYLTQPQSSEKSAQLKPLRRLGLLAAIFLDGTTRIFSVPHPDDIRTSINNNTSKSKSKSQDKEKQPICIKVDPILTLNVPSKVPSALAWGGERLAVAFVDGWIATWDIGRLLNEIKDFDREELNDMKPSKPSHLFQAHDSTILSLDFIRSPSLQAGKEDEVEDENGEETTRSGKDKGKTKTKGKEKQGNSSLREEIDHDKNPSQLISSGVDGRITLHDLRDPNASYSPHTVRDFALTPVYYPANQGLIADDPDGSIKTVSNRMGSFGHSSVLAYFTGKILDLSTSDYHPFIAGGSADGSVRVVNGVRSLLRKVIRNRVIYPVYQLEMNRETGQLRMLDNLNPVPATFTMPTEEEMKKSKVSIHKSNAHGYSAAGWHPSISIRCLKWSPNIGRSFLLASGTGCGLVRVDWVDNKGAEMETDNEIGKTLLNKIKTEIERLKKEERGDKTKSRQKKSRGKKDNNDDDVDEEMDELEG